jgi:LCP family protein required for cell wall assembly
MSQPHEAPPRERSAFAAAFLSLIFPGLGHAYAGAWRRAVLFAAAPILFLVFVAGTFLAFGLDDFVGLLANGPVMSGILVGNVVVYLYRIAAAVDAWRVVAFLNRYERREPRGGPSPTLTMLSVAGLVAVCLVMGGVHAAVGFYDSQAIAFDQAIHEIDPSDAPATPDPSDSFTAAPATASPDASAGETPSAAPADTPVPVPTWTKTQRLNVLLVGIDRRPGEHSFNTDTLIVVSVDPVSHQVAMFTIPRDSTGIPLPPGLRGLGSTWNNKINSLCGHIGSYQGGCFQALKDTLGYFYGIPIQYYVMVDFTGFEKVVDALGGVTINVQKPVVDDEYPGDNGHLRVYIPTGVQHMTGAEALVYARSRHGSTDFDRGARQQRVILSLRQQADLSALAQPQVLNSLLKAVGSAVKTDFPLNKIGAALELAQRIDMTNVRSFVFGPPTYATDMWPVSSNVQIKLDKIRRAVKNAFKYDPAQLKDMAAIQDEGATIWVLDGAGNGAASDVADYLVFNGYGASTPNQAAAKHPPDTVITVYNGAEAGLSKTIAGLQDIFGVKVVLANDPKVKTDIIITTGRNTPSLKAPSVGN